MNVSFAHANPATSHESTLLRVSPQEGSSKVYLIDAGNGVSPDGLVGPDESLDGVFLTHAHVDHYAGLGSILSETDGDETPLYTSPATATVLERLYTEADRYQNLGGAEPVSDALSPIEGWTALDDEVAVLPVPAGHTPGAAGYLFRIEDAQNHETVTVLVTGDFTDRSVAGYPGLRTPDGIEIDVVIANASTAESFEEELTGALDTVLERALGGATTLVAAGGLTGVHAAYLLGNLVTELDRRLTINLVGQAAKLYEALNYEVPSVTVHEEFADTDEVLEPGAVTIAGPEAPFQGSCKRLYGAISDDPDAVFVQFATSGTAPANDGTCASHYVELPNHPTEEAFVETVERNLPRHLILKHAHPSEAKELGSSFDNLFYWANDDPNEHLLYGDGNWYSPPWVSDSEATRIRRRNYRASGSRIPLDQPVEKLPDVPLERGSVDLEAEGIDVGTLRDRFESTIGATMPGETSVTTDSESATADSESATMTPKPATTDSEPATTDGGSGAVVEDSGGSAGPTGADADGLETRFDDVDSRLDTVEESLGELLDRVSSNGKVSVPGTVIRQDDLILVRVDSGVLEGAGLELEDGEEVRVSIEKEQ